MQLNDIRSARGDAVSLALPAANDPVGTPQHRMKTPGTAPAAAVLLGAACMALATLIAPAAEAAVPCKDLVNYTLSINANGHAGTIRWQSPIAAAEGTLSFAGTIQFATGSKAEEPITLVCKGRHITFTRTSQSYSGWMFAGASLTIAGDFSHNSPERQYGWYGNFELKPAAAAVSKSPESKAAPGQGPTVSEGPAVSYEQIARGARAVGKEEAEKLEAALDSRPDDLSARAKLLGFYFYNGRKIYGVETTIAARRRHILWLIEHQPASEAAGMPFAAFDASFGLADKEGQEQASKLWTAQAQRHGSNPAVLGNAAFFLQLTDRDQAEALLKRAQQAAPKGEWWSMRLGHLYALGILGIDALNQNGLPMSHDPAVAIGEFAKHARAELEKAADAHVLGTAGWIMAQYGLILRGMFRERFAVDYVPLAEALLGRAQELQPANPAWPDMLERFRKMRSEAGQAK
jgi:hypothetical protein